MKKNLLILLMSIFCNYSNGQQTFSMVYYDSTDNTYGHSIARSFDNGYLIAGSRPPYGLIYKIDSAGTIVWNKKYTVGSDAEFARIIPTLDSNFVVAGHSYSFPNQDLVCMKINASGDTLWSKTFGGINSEKAYSVEQTMDGGYVLTGNVSFPTAPYYKTMILKLDSAGNLEWNHVISTGSYSNQGYSAKQTPDSGYVLIGNTDSLSVKSLFIIKFNSSGSVSWNKKYDYATNWLLGKDIIVSSDGFACLLFNGNDYGLMKTDTSGAISGINFFQGTMFFSCSDCVQQRIYESSDSGLIFLLGADPFAGGFGQELVKTDSLGNIQWAQQIQLSLSGLAETSDKGFMVVGNGPLYGIRSQSGISSPQIGIVRTDSLGNNSSCNSPFALANMTDTFLVSSLAFTLGSFGTVNTVHPVISLDVLVSDSGCVPILGGFEDIEKNNFISIFPNPASSRINFLFKKSAKQFHLSIHNVLGQEVYSRLLTGAETRNFSMDADFSPGIYIVVLSDDRSVYSKKLVIE